MSTTPNTPAPAAPATSQSVLQKIEAWFHKAKLKVEADLTKIVGPELAGDLETAFAALLKTAEGQIAQKAVIEAADVATGQINVDQAVKATVAQIAATGKQISQSAATALVAAAQQKVQTLVAQGNG